MAENTKKSSMQDELEWIRALADVLTDTGLTEIEIEKDEISLRVAKTANAVQHVSTPVIQQQEIPSAPAPETPAPATAADAASHPGAVKSPMVGTAYMSPAPGADPFVSVGDNIKEGQTLMIVEAMKTMNEIKAPRSGTVTEILAKDAEPVEFGEALMILA